VSYTGSGISSARLPSGGSIVRSGETGASTAPSGRVGGSGSPSWRTGSILHRGSRNGPEAKASGKGAVRDLAHRSPRETRERATRLVLRTRSRRSPAGARILVFDDNGTVPIPSRRCYEELGHDVALRRGPCGSSRRRGFNSRGWRVLASALPSWTLQLRAPAREQPRLAGVQSRRRDRFMDESESSPFERGGASKRTSSSPRISTILQNVVSEVHDERAPSIG